jgi:hypothetical protein
MSDLRFFLLQLLRGPRDTAHRALTPALSHPMGEGARRAGEGNPVVYPGELSVRPH